MIKHRIIYNDASDWLFDIVKASGVYIWAKKGEKLLDFTSGWNVTNLGWNNNEIAEAMIKQINDNVYAPMETAENIQLQLAELLTDNLPKELDAVGRTTGGMEANEEAIKTARAYTKRSKILGFRHAYHGQSLTMMSIILDDNEMRAVGSRFGEMLKMEFPATYKSNMKEDNLLKYFESNLEEILNKEDVAALITEAGIITGWGSTYVAPKGYLKLVRNLTRKYNTLLILDEVGTGFSRCGELFGMNIEDVVPDIATFAKGFSNGASAIGAMVTTNKIADKTWPYTNLQSTFGWNLVGCAAAKKNLEIHLRDNIWQKSKSDGEYVRDVLISEIMKLEYIGDVRGFGMEIGISFVKNKETKEADIDLARKVMYECRKRGLYILYGDDGNIQLMPPLIIKRQDLDYGLNILIDTVKTLN
ncbi:hypothetical protein A2962_03335 [Candidatus Woesebacteria bacterium RIFCSPLOWO2_01_FULL_39_61]|uniref:Aminotransferase class III n=1 Tax=Candidatus Woesebacteria bacterium RIFCSPHIGHO2_02_FULL_39_13 TaxID=1802505 RepID=A0A1F7Z2I1_9BACT|nr:MAG: hypothetical protein A2692_04420 [Candidatus Woesebacteria bacterium RIFCSPHIGHO2_01_FULL_39_95]OGM33856.1 MAG: hypothetical protein A3D01_02705 [Candidatus Woesebacteria bacterium RIFCSPHIGHO2_02_FULL_39_13]OGM39017.1 MAG: hypothetical protein A3E13_04975 [Candidatus Woesebacteria bacterium RIFCSPHIGHO2_12_FULL_40_20]OGM67522.1 MAG: hypothetical protein A2962_03335 [Candidatus Woesebacteria bacterium RIFCSPLOWO2_01_FULL_39_61]OGM72853.1 MAG: hypothetical protein A3H19_05840 [Candidatus